MKNKIVVFTGDPLGEKMAGPGIRALNFASELSKSCEVVLATTGSCNLNHSGFEIRPVQSTNQVSELEKWADVLVIQGNILMDFPVLKKSKKYLVCDLYDPMHLEQLEQGKSVDFNEWNIKISHASYVLSEQIRRGDFFLAATQRQRDFWLGSMVTLGRINAATYTSDGNLEDLIGIVPFGFSKMKPRKTKEELRGIIPGIHSRDKILLWAGGIYNWFDPETLIRAVDHVIRKRPNVKLFFMGTQHPNPGVPEMEILNKSYNLAKELQILNKNVFFNSEWVPYNSRQNYLLTADAGVSTHFNHLETRFSFRTRILDYIWAGLPVLTSEGDEFADLVEHYKLGIVVPEKNVEKLSDAIDQILFDEKKRKLYISNILKFQEKLTWHSTTAPLINYCKSPKFAADLVVRSKTGLVSKKAPPPSGTLLINVRNKLYNIYNRYKSEGLGGVLQLINRRLVHFFRIK